MIYPTDDDFVQITRIDEGGRKCTRVLCKAITKEENKKLENDDNIELVVDGRSYIISNRNCYCFGHIDFDDPIDVSLINSFKWINLEVASSFVPRNYDYNTHIGDSINGGPVFVETSSNITALKYAHARLKKPEYIAIIAYKTTFNFKQ